MLLHKKLKKKSSHQLSSEHTGHSYIPSLIVSLIGVYLTLLCVGTFCASLGINPNAVHHSHQTAPTSIFCSWACQVIQIEAKANPTTIFSAFFVLLVFSVLKPPSFSFVFSSLAHLHARPQSFTCSLFSFPLDT